MTKEKDIAQQVHDFMAVSDEELLKGLSGFKVVLEDGWYQLYWIGK
jgi:hypothetical protein